MSEYEHEATNEYDHEGSGAGIAYDIVATIIFMTMSLIFFFPCNSVFPLDRRTASVFCATLCYLTRSFLFSERKMNLVEAIDFEVLVLLAAIMAINFIIVHQQETRKVVERLQNEIRANPRKGFWYVSFAAFVVSPFLTNDGVCLLFVEPILNAFDGLEKTAESHTEHVELKALSTKELSSAHLEYEGNVSVLK